MQGRQLASLTTNGKTYTYSYDADGIRTSKAVVVDTYRYRTSSGGSIVSITPGNEANALDLPIKPYPGETYIRFLFGTKTVTHNYVTQNGKVVRETIDDGVSEKVLDFIYDTAGKPFALIYTNGTAESETYYYVLNLQGDVVKLLDEDGAEVANYRYNAWGEILSATGDMAEINPLRYRGYYYDAETGFYYLQSRYYDPVNCRFINADGYASTGQGFLGYNMFAYCGNNPVRRIDIAGTGWIEDAWDWITGAADDACDWVSEAASDVCDWVSEAASDVCDWVVDAADTVADAAVDVYDYVTNTDEQVVLEADFIAFYKGKLVIKLPIKDNAFSFGVIFLGDDIQNPNTLKHEYGHAVHFDQIGIIKYTACVAIPSVIGFWTDADDYYSQPWEYTADVLGGVDRGDYTPNAKEKAFIYLLAVHCYLIEEGVRE